MMHKLSPFYGFSPVPSSIRAIKCGRRLNPTDRNGGRYRPGNTLLPLLVVIVLMAASFPAWAVQSRRPTLSRSEAAALDAVQELSETDPAAAAGLLDAEVAAGRAGAATLFMLANLRLQTEDYKAAEAALRSALEELPEFDAARVGLGRVLALSERWAEAEAELRMIATRQDADLPELLLYGYVLLQLERPVSAETIYRRAVLVGAEMPDALFGLAQCFMRQQRPRETAATLETLVRRHPAESGYWAMLADALLAMDEPRAAAVRLETARRLAVVTPPMMALLGDLYVQAGQPEQARLAYEQAVAGADDGVGLLLRAAEGMLFAGETMTAGQWLERVASRMDRVDAPPSQRRAFYRARALWSEQADGPEPAREAYREWVAHDPLNVEALLGLGDHLSEAGDFESARMWYERARGIEPHNAEPQLRLARLAIDRRRYGEAAGHLERAGTLRTDPAIDRALRQVRRLEALSDEN